MPNSTLPKLLGDELVTKGGDKLAVDSLCGDERVVGLLFSAQWCGPCRAFMPLLAAFYKNFKNTTKAEQLEIVFVSSDHDQEQFEEFFQEMPWPGMPYPDRERTKLLFKKFRVQSVPTLIFIESLTGHVITSNGRELVTEDPEGRDFPWRPRSVREALSEGQFVSTKGDAIDASALTGLVRGIYFSANWCPPCKAFTPQLVDVYEKVREAGHHFEVIFVSSDRSVDSFEHYFASMPWLAVPYDDEKRRKELTMLFGVQGIPTLVIVDKEGNIITKDGRFEVLSDLQGAKFPWKPELVSELTEKFASKLNEDPCLILFSDGDEKEMQLCRSVLIPVAEENAQNKLGGPEDANLNFFVGGENEMCDSLREFAELEDSVPLLVIFDIPEGKQYLLEDDVEITADVVRTFVQKFYARQLEGRPLRE